jgi:CheY-like chemotaxis protein
LSGKETENPGRLARLPLILRSQLLLTGRKLLLADDSLTIQKVVSLTFGDEGMQVTTVGNGAEALKQLEAAAPDIVLADVHMPAPDGYQVCAHIKQDERFKRTPVLLLVGTFEPFNEAEARRVGADDVLTKPFQSIRELISKVGNLLGGQKEEPPPEETKSQEPVATAHADVPTVDMHEAARSEVDERAASHAQTWTEPHTERAAPATPVWTPAPQTSAYNDFDMDDQTIQTTPAEAFGRPTAPVPPPAAAEEFEPERELKHTEDTEEESVIMLHELPEPEAQPEPMRAPQPAAELSYAGAGAAAAFATIAPPAPNDDALLDLGENEPLVAPAETNDESILDLGEEPVATATEADAPLVMYAEGMASSPAEAVEPLVTTDAPQTDARALEADVEAYAQPPQLGQDFEQVLPESDEQPVVAASPEAAAQDVAASGSQQAGATELSPEMIDAIARRVVELMSDAVVREVAWEVVPDLAERLIKQRLQAEHTQETR